MKHTIVAWVRRGIAGGIALLPLGALAQTGENPALTGPMQSGLPVAPIIDIAGSTMDWILGLLGFIAIIGFVISGILYLTAAGNDGQIKTAKEAMKWSIVGVIVALMGYVIVQAVDVWLSADSYF
jgi:hypothetical protein